MSRHIIFLLTLLCASIQALGADPTATRYSYAQCAGTAMPYPAVDMALRAIPDSLTPVFINHVGRHGARFMSSAKVVKRLQDRLQHADSARLLTPAGKQLLALCSRITTVTAGRWGALDSLGMAEQRGIASRMYMLAPGLFKGTTVSAISSYVPRCIASMNEFTHQLSRLDNDIEIYTSSGRQNNALLRPWMADAEYKEFISSGVCKLVVDSLAAQTIPAAAISKIVTSVDRMTPDEVRSLALDAYKVVSGCAAMGLDVHVAAFFNEADYNALWSVGNLGHYLTHSASTLSTAPMELAAALLKDLVETTSIAADGNTNGNQRACLRFGHAETLMPLLALMRMQGCYYMTNYFDTVGLHWRDFHVVPMASNLQLILLRSKGGHLYLRADLNEKPVPLIPGRPAIYTPWHTAKEYLTRCLPFVLQ